MFIWNEIFSYPNYVRLLNFWWRIPIRTCNNDDFLVRCSVCYELFMKKSSFFFISFMNNEHLLSNSLCSLVYHCLFRLLMNVVILVFIAIPYFCFLPLLSWSIWQLNRNNDSFIFSWSKLTITFEFQLLSLSITITSHGVIALIVKIHYSTIFH